MGSGTNFDPITVVAHFHLLEAHLRLFFRQEPSHFNDSVSARAKASTPYHYQHGTIGHVTWWILSNSSDSNSHRRSALEASPACLALIVSHEDFFFDFLSKESTNFCIDPFRCRLVEVR